MTYRVVAAGRLYGLNTEPIVYLPTASEWEQVQNAEQWSARDGDWAELIVVAIDGICHAAATAADKIAEDAQVANAAAELFKEAGQANTEKSSRADHKREWVTQACALKIQYPEMTSTEISGRIGVNKSQLSRNDLFITVKKRVEAGSKRSIGPGFRKESGDVEVISEDDE